MPDTLLDRFLRYVKIDTQSDPDSPTAPSTDRQWVLLRLLERELNSLGASGVTLTPQGYLLATIPATSDQSNLPTIAFLAHVDTSPDYSGENVRPIVHRRYNGKPIVLPDAQHQVIDPALYPELRTAVGKDVVTASGKTLLGADDKAGVAEVMTLAAHLLAHPEIEHGPIRLCFTPDEEVGRGVDHLDLDQLGADAAYTLDGENPGEVVWETFSADEAVVTIEGVSTHPGEARKRGMVNAVHLAGKLLAALPRENWAPESTDLRQGYVHPHRIDGNTEKTKVTFILRDHDTQLLEQHGQRLRKLVAGFQAAEPRARFKFQVRPQYRNMGEWLKDDLTPVDLACEAVRAIGLQPTSPATRGGTDGSRLTERGLPTPNLFCGGHNAHGPLEWVAVQDMEQAVAMCVELVKLWAQKGAGYKRRRPSAKAAAKKTARRK